MIEIMIENYEFTHVFLNDLLQLILKSFYDFQH